MVDERLIQRIRGNNIPDIESINVDNFAWFKDGIQNRKDMIKDLILLATEWINNDHDISMFTGLENSVSFIFPRQLDKAAIGKNMMASDTRIIIAEGIDHTIDCYTQGKDGELWYMGDKFCLPISRDELEAFLKELDSLNQRFQNHVQAVLDEAEMKAAEFHMNSCLSYVNHQCNKAVHRIQQMQRMIQLQYEGEIGFERFIDSHTFDTETYGRLVELTESVDKIYNSMLDYFIKNACVDDIFHYIYSIMKMRDIMMEDKHVIPQNGIDWNIILSEKIADNFIKPSLMPDEDGYYICTIIKDGERELEKLYWKSIKNYWELNGEELKGAAVLAYAKIEPLSKDSFDNFIVRYGCDETLHCVKNKVDA